MSFLSPLRYPGGKRKLAEFVGDVVNQNGIQKGTYVEPFAGGASVALYLLLNNIVSNIIINDIDRSIYAFWYSVLNHSRALCNKIAETDISLDEWERQKSVQLQKDDADLFDLGFSTLFLNRTNRSGIISGGVIGGKSQSGNWKINARFNKTNLINRIQRISLLRDRISLHCSDAIDFIRDIMPVFNENTLVYFDPPYYNKGSALYVNHYTHEDHVNLAQFIRQLNCKWMLSYDYTPEIVELYRNYKKRLLTLSYTAAEKLRGKEILAFSNDCEIPDGPYKAITITRWE